MPYNQFTLSAVKEAFDLETEEGEDLFAAVGGVEISDLLNQILQRNVPLSLAIGTEKAHSELIVMPILVELRELVEPPISLFSGIAFNVDRKSGLSGTCDFIISRSKEQFFVDVPVIAIVEAKNENVRRGIGQCIAAMFAARLFNERKGNAITTIYGVVTTGSVWKFLKLKGQIAYIDLREYYIQDVSKILGILLSMIRSCQ
ncbi:MAG: hypothetical protein O7E52_07865 [Candidatus Poribacteria bacterium]|nr:hypothetical protein [Candidatus Poribacteria bacterium]